MLTANRVASRSAVITVGGDCIAAELVDSNESCIANAPLRLVRKAACTDADQVDSKQLDWNEINSNSLRRIELIR
jgi:hypothetical protein